MRHCLFLMLVVVCIANVNAALPVPERVNISSLDRDEFGAPVVIPALYFRTVGAIAGARIPLVIAVHGCGGMFGARAGRKAQISDRFAAWTAQFLDDGYAVLWPDSFTSRSRREICTIKTGERTIGVPTRRLDILGALAHAAEMPGVDRDRIAVVGWSHGGSTTLAAINTRDAGVAAGRNHADAPYFRTAVAFYPGCAAALRAGTRWQTSIPTAIHIGELDDWTPARPCVELGDAMQARGDPLAVTVHPGSHHGFDGPGSRVIVLHAVPNGVNPGQGVTVGPNPAARAAAIASVRSFLRERLQPEAEHRPGASLHTRGSPVAPGGGGRRSILRDENRRFIIGVSVDTH